MLAAVREDGLISDGERKPIAEIEVETSDRFRPACFALYNASSAALISPSTSSPFSGKLAIPAPVS
ncbi:MAG: hypothetical protein R3C11_28250 [Planctomycetaceae bacterium]